MLRIDVQEAGSQLKLLLARVARGEEVILVEQNKEVARLVPPLRREQWLSRTRQFRKSLQVKGEALSTTIISTRQEERN